MRVRLPDSAIPIVNFQLDIGVAADLASTIDRILLGVEVAARSAATAPADIPPAPRIGDNVMRSTCILPSVHHTLLVSQNRESKFAIANLAKDGVACGVCQA